MAAPPVHLREFLALLRSEGELVEVEAEVDASLELAEIHRRVIAAGGPALLFKRVRASDLPVVTNLFGTRRRVELAFGSRPRELIEELARLPEELVPPSIGKLWSKRGLFGSLLRIGMRKGRGGPVSEVVESPPRLDRLPALQSWPRDGGRFLTLPLVYTEHPETGGGNLGMYRMQITGADSAGMHIQIHRGAGFHLAAAEEVGRSLPAVVTLGGPPALVLSAIAPLPENVCELALASLLLARPLALSRHDTSPLPFAREAELALVGEIPAGERRPEGPFGDHYGYYSEVHDFPWFRCKAVLRRRDAIFPATVVGKPRQEDFFIGDYLQDLLSPLFPLVMPSVRELWSYGETGYHPLSVARVEERYRREAMVSAFRILGEGQLSLTKFLLLVDRPLDLRDFRAVLTHVLERADFHTDLFVFSNLSMDTLDYAGPRLNEGSKGVLLGIGEARRELPVEFTGTPGAAVRDVRVFCPGCLVLEAPAHSEDPDVARRIARDPAFADWPLLVLSDTAERAARSAFNFLWTTFTRFDPASDVTAAEVELVGAHASFTPPLVLDARMKAAYPEELFSDADTARRVERRWNDYFPDHLVEMGEANDAHLD
ncbi:MAG: 4-hydroxybenzoate decarboxylase [Planctomycetes bacterium]|nr:4-hydroxybenzoate decarboxylase [Planctomycetota bacterium]MDP6407930.1 UbiD family decarboxylase [Planctomycetota bacterium]